MLYSIPNGPNPLFIKGAVRSLVLFIRIQLEASFLRDPLPPFPPPPFAGFKPLWNVFALMKLKCNDIHSVLWLCICNFRYIGPIILRYMYSRCEFIVIYYNFCHGYQYLLLNYDMNLNVFKGLGGTEPQTKIEDVLCTIITLLKILTKISYILKQISWETQIWHWSRSGSSWVIDQNNVFTCPSLICKSLMILAFAPVHYTLYEWNFDSITFKLCKLCKHLSSICKI